MPDNPVPEGYRTVTPYLVVRDVDEEIGFLTRALGATVKERVVLPDGVLTHGEVTIGDSVVMIGRARGTAQPHCSTLYVYVADVDATYAAALAAGAVSLQAPADQFYGDRCGGVRDPLGNAWWLATRQETLDETQIRDRWRKMREPEKG